jgi:hypothetical protein
LGQAIVAAGLKVITINPNEEKKMNRKLSIGFLLLISTILCGQEYRVGDHELIFMPTAYTMEKGSAYFTDYELFFLNYTYAPTSTTHVGLFTLFPITTDFLETASLGVKQNLVRGTGVADAAWVTYTPKGSLLTIGDVISIGKPANGLHLSVSAITDLNSDNTDWYILYMAGYRYDFSRKASLLLEYMNAQVAMDEADFNGLISIGIRFHSESIAWEIGGFRPLQESGDLFLFPIVKGTFLF